MAREELRSARFAHPQGRRNDEQAATPRPGVSYIAPASRAEPSLPRVAPVRHADISERAEPERRERVQNYPASQLRTQAPERTRPEPRFERAEVARPAYVREQPSEVARPAYVREQPREVARPAYVREQPREVARPAYVREQPRSQPQPMYREPPRQMAQPPRQEAPRYAPPRREAPPARAEAQRVKPADQRKDSER